MMERIEEFVESLRGTCRSIDEACNEFGMTFEDLTGEDLEYIDNEIFCCEDCGWWCELCETSYTVENTCKDCNPEDEE